MPPRHRKRTISDAFKHLNEFKTKNPLSDPGNHPPEHYKPHMNSIRFRIRNWFLPYVLEETPKLYAIQNFLRCKVLDYYFAYSANLGSHTFYVIMLPFPSWFGSPRCLRDLVFVLGYSIYGSGYFKDFTCLPRPQSPPVRRITLSDYTSQEYGSPSSHTANATAVLFLMLATLAQQELSQLEFYLAVCGLVFYYLTLVMGRIYCGMHGFLDLESGAIIGFLTFLIRWYFRDAWDSALLGHTWWYLPLILLINYGLLFGHAIPVDNCPCYEDSVAFVGVIIGLEISQYIYSQTPRFDYTHLGYHRLELPYSFEHLGVFKSVLRVIVGVLCVVVWREVAKPLVFGLLQPFFKEKPRSKKKPEPVTVGQEESDTHVEYETTLHEPVPPIEIIGRSIIYAGIPLMVVVVSPYMFDMCGILYEP